MAVSRGQESVSAGTVLLCHLATAGESSEELCNGYARQQFPSHWREQM